MATKATKESFANKLGFKSSGSKAVEAELEKVKKENGQLKKTLDEMSKRNGRPHPTCPNSDKTKLLEVSVFLSADYKRWTPLFPLTQLNALVCRRGFCHWRR